MKLTTSRGARLSTTRTVPTMVRLMKSFSMTWSRVTASRRGRTTAASRPDANRRPSRSQTARASQPRGLEIARPFVREAMHDDDAAVDTVARSTASMDRLLTRTWPRLRGRDVSPHVLLAGRNLFMTQPSLSSVESSRTRPPRPTPPRSAQCDGASGILPGAPAARS